MRLSLITSSNIEPLTLKEAKEHLRVDFDKEDVHITKLIASAREAFERDTGRQLLTATYDGFLDRFPMFDVERIEIARPPLLSVTTVNYIDTSGVSQTWADTEYTEEAYVGPFAQRGEIYPSSDETYPDERRIRNAVTIRFDAGYGPAASDIPLEIKEALLGWIGYRYNNREMVITGVNATEMPGLGFESWQDQDFE